MSSRFERALKRLQDLIPEYIEKVGRFQHQNRTFKLVQRYIATTYKQCQICGHKPIKEVYVIQDAEGNKLNVGNVCIDKIANQKISKWFQNVHKRIENLKNNKEVINNCERLLKTNIITISAIGRKRLRAMLNRMLDGRNPTQKQVDLLVYYARKYNDALKRARD